jgi:cell division protein FtsB
VKRRLGIGILLGVALGLTLLVWYSDKGLKKMLARRAQVTAMARENQGLAAKNQNLARRIVRLRRNSELTLKTIRLELTPLIRPDEIIFLFPSAAPERPGGGQVK